MSRLSQPRLAPVSPLNNELVTDDEQVDDADGQRNENRDESLVGVVLLNSRKGINDN